MSVQTVFEANTEAKLANCFYKAERFVVTDCAADFYDMYVATFSGS